MNLITKNISVREARKFVVILYVVGASGFALPYSRGFFMHLTPFALLTSFVLLIAYHQEFSKRTDVIVFIVVYILGFLVEFVGVRTGAIFGSYTYGNGLGIKVLETPLLIGVNWLLLVYTSLAVVNKLKIQVLIKPIAASFIMLGYDLIMEQVAPQINMWFWLNDVVPFKNYLSWFLVALVGHIVFHLFKVKVQSPIAALLFICQFVFFLFLLLLFKLLP